MTTTAPAVQNGKPSLAQLIQQMRPEIARALPKHLNPDRMARIATTALRQTPALARTTPESFLGALLTASQLGLEPGPTGEAYLVPYGNACTFVPGYRGLIKLARNSGQLRDIWAEVVYANDEFSYSLGLHRDLVHVPAKGERGAPIYVYAAAELRLADRRWPHLPGLVRHPRNRHPQHEGGQGVCRRAPHLPAAARVHRAMRPTVEQPGRIGADTVRRDRLRAVPGREARPQSHRHRTEAQLLAHCRRQPDRIGIGDGRPEPLRHRGARVKDELSQTCPVCNAAKDEPCVNTLHPGEPLPGRDFHIGRTEK